MSPNIDNGPAEVPLVEQLLSVPRTCHEMIEVGECAHRNIPYGEFCHMAAEEINNLVRIHAFNAGAFQAREAEIASLRLALAASRDEAEKAKADSERLDWLEKQLGGKRFNWGYDRQGGICFQPAASGCDPSLSYSCIRDTLDAARADAARKEPPAKAHGCEVGE